MKLISSHYLLAVLVFLATAFSACDKNCAETQCIRGECIDNSCVCDIGYEGAECAQARNDKFSGSYSLSETCILQSGSGSYVVLVEPKTGTTELVHFVGLYEASNMIATATLASDGTSFTIARQPLLNGYEIEARSGSISADAHTINLTYEVYQTGDTTVYDQCTSTLTR